MSEVRSIREHMDVIGSDGERVGTVDRLVGDHIKLAKQEPGSGGVHHLIPCEWVARVEGERVRLNRTCHEARANWRALA